MKYKIRIKKSGIAEKIKIYRKFIRNDFPSHEIKPFSTMLKKHPGGYCEFYTFRENRKTVGYAVFFVVEGKNMRLLDYFGVMPELRDRGYGSRIIEAMKMYFNNTGDIIAEVANPDYAENDAERDIRSRRVRFYEKNGFELTSCKSKLWATDYKIYILRFSDSVNLTPADLKDIYYRVFGEEKFNKNIKIYE